MSEVARKSELATRIMNETLSEMALHSPELPASVREAREAFIAGVNSHLGVATQLESDIVELTKKRDLLPEAGWRRLRDEAIQESELRTDTAARVTKAGMDHLRSELTQAAIPEVDTARESLDRSELEALLGTATGDALRLRVEQIAQTAPPGVTAVLLRTSFGQSVLTGRGLVGRDLDETLTAARRTAAALATTRGTTRRQRDAGKALARMAKLGAVQAAAYGAIISARG